MSHDNKTVRDNFYQGHERLGRGKASWAYQLEDIILLKHSLYQLRVKIDNIIPIKIPTESLL